MSTQEKGIWALYWKPSQLPMAGEAMNPRGDSTYYSHYPKQYTS